MSREAHVRFWESPGVRFPRATQLFPSAPRRGSAPSHFWPTFLVASHGGQGPCLAARKGYPMRAFAFALLASVSAFLSAVGAVRVVGLISGPRAVSILDPRTVAGGSADGRTSTKSTL